MILTLGYVVGWFVISLSLIYDNEYQTERNNI